MAAAGRRPDTGAGAEGRGEALYAGVSRRQAKPIDASRRAVGSNRGRSGGMLRAWRRAVRGGAWCTWT